MSARQKLWLRVVATLLALALFTALTPLSLDALRAALTRLSGLALGGALLLGLLNFGVGAVRWRQLFLAFGATTLPPTSRLARLHLEGAFYNTFLPANVGGDLLRAHVTRDAFEHRGGAWLVVALERVFGLAGLFLVAGLLQTIHPVGGTAEGMVFGLVGVALGGVAFACALSARALGKVLPGRLGALLRGLPKLSRPARLVPVVLLSLMTHSLVALSGALLLHSIAPSASSWEVMVLVPLAMAATYAPTLAGLGAREAAFVVLLGLAGVSADAATAASLGMLAVQIGLASIGGLLYLAPHGEGA